MFQMWDKKFVTFLKIDIYCYNQNDADIVVKLKTKKYYTHIYSGILSIRAL